MKCLKVTSLIPTTSGADLHLDLNSPTYRLSLVLIVPKFYKWANA